MLVTRRSLLMSVGSAILIFSAVIFLGNAVLYLVPTDDTINLSSNSPHILLLLSSVPYFILFVSFAISGIAYVVSGAQMKKEGKQGRAITLCGLGDFFNAQSLLAFFIVAMIEINKAKLMSMLGCDWMGIENIQMPIVFLIFLSEIIAGSLYLISGIKQKQAGKSDRLLIVAGVCFLVGILAFLVMCFVDSAAFYETYFVYMSIDALVMLVGFAFRAASLLSSAKASKLLPH